MTTATDRRPAGDLLPERASRIRRGFGGPVGSITSSGSALVLASAATAGLGSVFWVMAARLYTPDELGVGAAAVTTLTLVAGIGHLGWKNALVRFMGDPRLKRRSLLVHAYRTAGIATALLATAFILTQPLWSSDLAPLREGAAPVLFVVGAVGWVIFTLQDNALVGLHRAHWLPVENTAFALLKILLLAPMALWNPVLGVFLAWALAAIPVDAVVNVVVLRNLHDDGGQSEDFRDIRRFAVADWTGGLAELLAVSAMPLLVLALLGTDSNAFYHIGFTVAHLMWLVVENLCDALVAHGAASRDSGPQLVRKTVMMISVIAGPMLVIMLVAAPLVLSIFGAEYAQEASSTLRVLSVSVIPFSVLQLALSWARINNRRRAMLTINIATYVLVVALAIPFMLWWGVVGVALAWVVAMTCVAVAVGGLLLRNAASATVRAR